MTPIEKMEEGFKTIPTGPISTGTGGGLKALGGVRLP